MNNIHSKMEHRLFEDNIISQKLRVCFLERDFNFGRPFVAGIFAGEK